MAEAIGDGIEAFGVYDEDGALIHMGEFMDEALTHWTQHPGSSLIAFKPVAERIMPPGYSGNFIGDSRWQPTPRTGSTPLLTK